MAVFFFASLAAAQEVVPSTSIVISIAEQKLTILRDGCFWRKYPISTSKYGVGDSYGSYKTPLGNLRVCEKIGEELAVGSVIKERRATGEVLLPNAPGRDPIVTRILWLDGLEEQNHNARSRGIYIHGTTEEGKIGKPVSYGCIRMRSKDVQEVFDQVNIDTSVQIISDKFPRYAKYTPPKPQVIVAAPPPKSLKTVPATLPPAIADAPVPGKKIAATGTTAVSMTPYHPPVIEPRPIEPHGSVTTTEVSRSAMAHAMEGSILSAGLPDGPKIPTLPEPPAPKEIQRFGGLSPESSREKGLSLQGTDLSLVPPVQPADAAATGKQQGADDTDNAAKPAPHVAFRVGDTNTKAKP
jgi:hypothetical protein